MNDFVKSSTDDVIGAFDNRGAKFPRYSARKRQGCTTLRNLLILAFGGT